VAPHVASVISCSALSWLGLTCEMSEHANNFTLTMLDNYNTMIEEERARPLDGSDTRMLNRLVAMICANPLSSTSKNFWSLRPYGGDSRVLP